MPETAWDSEVLVIGGGPAGIAAACSASEGAPTVTLVDDNPGIGGQIWRGDESAQSVPEAKAWWARLLGNKVRVIRGARVFGRSDSRTLLAETSDTVAQLSYHSLILATGARERFLPFPGWTLPNVVGAGGLQALVKSGLSVEGKRVVVAGSGPLLLAVAAYLADHGARVVAIGEQTSRERLFRFAVRLAGQPGKTMQAIRLRRRLAGVPYLTNCWPVAASGNERLESVRLRRGRRTRDIPCDYLACGFFLVPNLELPLLLGCAVTGGAVKVNEYQETSVPAVYSCGESTGIGGLELSLAEGRIAGYAASGGQPKARRFFGERNRQRRFARCLNETFALRDELRSLARPETFVCRCEDVTLGQLRAHDSWRDAKLQTRCGMGPCQGRICGGATEFLLGWRNESVRPPIFPAGLGSL